MKQILIIEDDIPLREELKKLLQENGYSAFILDDFNHPIKTILNGSYDLILLDIHLPNLNGNYLLKEIRKESNIPIIMVTSKNTELDEVMNMSLGADDYITKPYNPNILILHIQALFKRIDQEVKYLKYKDINVNIKNGSLSKNEQEIILTKNEMLIFYYLLNKKGQIVTRDELMTTLWNNDEYINDNALTVNISRLRNKLKELGYEDHIETRKGLGYILI